MPTWGSFVRLPCLYEFRPTIQEGYIQSLQSNSVKTKCKEKRETRGGRRESCNPFFSPEYERSGLKTKVFNSLLPWRVDPLSLPETPPCVCVCMCLR